MPRGSASPNPALIRSPDLAIALARAYYGGDPDWVVVPEEWLRAADAAVRLIHAQSAELQTVVRRLEEAHGQARRLSEEMGALWTDLQRTHLLAKTVNSK